MVSSLLFVSYALVGILLISSAPVKDDATCAACDYRCPSSVKAICDDHCRSTCPGFTAYNLRYGSRFTPRVNHCRFAVCSQICVERFLPTPDYICACKKGFFLSMDGKTCIVADSSMGMDFTSVMHFLG